MWARQSPPPVPSEASEASEAREAREARDASEASEASEARAISQAYSVGILFYNSLLSIPFLLCFAAVSGDIQQALNSPDLYNVRFLVCRISSSSSFIDLSFRYS